MVVRRESVVLDLQDRFTGPMARPIAATALLKRNLDDLDGTATKLGRSGGLQTVADKTLPAVDKNARKADQSINQLTGRLRLLARASAILGPGLVPVGAAGLPGIAAMATQAGAAASAIGVIALAVNGLGDGLKALNEYQLEPTAENLEKVRGEFAKLGPDGADFVRYLDQIEPQLRSLQMVARAGMLPGFEAGIDAALERLPRLRRIVGEVATAVGGLGEDAGEALGGPEWTAFFRWLDQEAAPIVDELGRTVGNFALGLANLLVAFSPLSSSFSGGLLEMSRSFAEWSAGLDENRGFQEFLDYIEANGPRVLDLVGSLIDLLAGVVQAAAPVGAVVVPILTKVLDVFAAVANSDLGTPIFTAMAALSAYNQALLVTASLQSKVNAGSGVFGRFAGPQASNARTAIQGVRTDVAALGATWATAGARTTREQQRMSAAARSLRANLGSLAGTAARVGAPMAGVALAATGAADGFALANTATYALMGTWFGPWGTAAGAAIGLTMDLAAANNDLENAVSAADDAISGGQIAAMEQRRTELQAALDAHDEERSRANSPFDIGGMVSDPLGNFAAVRAGLVEITGGADEARAKIKELDAAIAEGPNNFQKAAAAQSQYAGAVRNAALADTEQARALEQATAAMRAKRQETLRGLNAELDYRGAILDARDALKANGETTNENTRKGQANLRALYNLAGAWNEQAAKTKNASGALREARANFISTATAMGMSEERARRLAQRLFEIPKQRIVQIELPGVGAHLAVTQQLANTIDRLHDRTITITTQQRVVRSVTDALPDRTPRSADGTTVPKTGRGYADRHLYLLADGEEVVSNRYGQADRHRQLLKAINGNRLAGGGTTGPRYEQMTLPGRPHGVRGTAAGIDLTQGVDAVRSALDALHESIRKSGRRWTADLTQMSRAMVKSAREYEKTAAQLATARQERNAYAQEVATAYSHDLFGNGLAGLQLQLSADTNDANAAKKGLRGAAKKGLATKDDPRTKGIDEGAFYRQLAASGDLNTIQQLANATPAEIQRIQRAYQQRAAATGGLGAYAADQQSGGVIKQLERELREDRREQKRLMNKLHDRLDHLPKNVRDGAEDGTRKGAGDRDRNVSQRTRGGR